MLRVLVILLALASPTLAQQSPPSPELLQRMIAECQASRGQTLAAFDGLAAQYTMMRDENAKLKARVEELEKKTTKK